MRTKTLLTLAAAALVVGCGASPTKLTETLNMETLVVEGDGAGHVTVAYDAQGLFEEGTDAFQSQRFDSCEQKYGQLLLKFPQSRYAHSALYNRGLCLEQLKKHTLAAASFKAHAVGAKALKDRRDGEFRYGFNLVAAGEYPAADTLYTHLIGAKDLGDADKAECHLRRGTARMHLERVGEADRDLKTAMALVRKAYEFLEGNDIFAEANFRRGEIYQGLSRGVHLKLPVEKMQADLRDKVRYFRQAQNSFIDTLNARHTYWATAAGLKLGELYEQFYDDVINAETPDDFDAETRKFYALELQAQLQPLLEQSLVIYEKNITMSQRIGAQNEWVDETERRLVRLRGLLEQSEKAKKTLEEIEPKPEAGPKKKRKTGHTGGGGSHAVRLGHPADHA